MTLKEARTLHAFSSWATQRIIDALAPLPHTLLTKDLHASHQSVLGTLRHIVSAERIWLGRFTGDPSVPILVESEAPDLPAVRKSWEDVGFATAKWLGSLTDQKLTGTFTAPSPEGRVYTHTFAQAFQHVVDHGTYHRGQIISLLRQMEIVPPNTGLIRFYRETGKMEG